jgi:NAD(P)-dependent dehydrogenase (short-subunit alcohol dehydrogenase family)
VSELVFGDPDGDHVAFALSPADAYGSFGDGVRVVVAGRRHDLERQGVEALALAHLRDDLRALLEHEDGEAFFTDHDWCAQVSLVRDGDTVRATVDAPEPDVWDAELPPMPLDRVAALADLVDDLERRYGPLTGHCGCGAPRRWFRRKGAAT